MHISVYWANLQPAIGSPCRADKRRAGDVGSLLVEERARNMRGALLCRDQSAGEDGAAMAVSREHGAGCMPKRLAAPPPASLTARDIRWGFTRRLNEERKLSPKRVFPSFDSALPFPWRIRRCFFIPQAVRSLSHTNPWGAYYRVPKVTGQSCGGGKSYKAANIICWTYWKVWLVFLQFFYQDCWWLFRSWWIQVVLHVCSSVPLSPVHARPKQHCTKMSEITWDV